MNLFIRNFWSLNPVVSWISKKFFELPIQFWLLRNFMYQLIIIVCLIDKFLKFLNDLLLSILTNVNLESFSKIFSNIFRVSLIKSVLSFLNIFFLFKNQFLFLDILLFVRIGFILLILLISITGTPIGWIDCISLIHIKVLIFKVKAVFNQHLFMRKTNLCSLY